MRLSSLSCPCGLHLLFLLPGIPSTWQIPIFSSRHSTGSPSLLCESVPSLSLLSLLRDNLFLLSAPNSLIHICKGRNIYSLRFSDWGCVCVCVSYIDEGQINRIKGIYFFTDVNIFTCMGALQERSENLKKGLDLKAYIAALRRAMHLEVTL